MAPASQIFNRKLPPRCCVSPIAGALGGFFLIGLNLASAVRIDRYQSETCKPFAEEVETYFTNACAVVVMTSWPLGILSAAAILGNIELPPPTNRVDGIPGSQHTFIVLLSSKRINTNPQISTRTPIEPGKKSRKVRRSSDLSSRIGVWHPAFFRPDIERASCRDNTNISSKVGENTLSMFERRSHA